MSLTYIHGFPLVHRHYQSPLYTFLANFSCRTNIDQSFHTSFLFFIYFFICSNHHTIPYYLYFNSTYQFLYLRVLSLSKQIENKKMKLSKFGPTNASRRLTLSSWNNYSIIKSLLWTKRLKACIFLKILTLRFQINTLNNYWIV